MEKISDETERLKIQVEKFRTMQRKKPYNY